MNIRKKLHIIPFLLIICILSACTSADEPDFSKLEDSYTSGASTMTSSAYCYRNSGGNVMILEYETMASSVLCNKPNCQHKDLNCITVQLGENTPLISGNYAYYFIDDAESIEPNEEGKADLKLGTNLYRYDFGQYKTEKILHVDNVSASYNCYGWLLHEGKIYFIGNWKGREYDENGIMESYGNSGGKMELYAIDLATEEIENYGDLYDVEALSEVYPAAKNSGEVYMKGLYDNKIYFDVAVVELLSDKEGDFRYVSYTKYYDLETNTFSPDPEDLSNISYGGISFLSEDYLAIADDAHHMNIYKNGVEDPITITDDSFSLNTVVSVYDDTLFYRGVAYDLNTQQRRVIDGAEDYVICAKYEDSYIVTLWSQVDDTFEKIPVSEITG